jgi:transcriptional regulator with XRE-family HTH domain
MMASFTERLVSLREGVGLSRANLATLLNMSEMKEEAYETGYLEPPIEMLYRISEIFGVSEGYVLGVEDTPDICEDNSVREIYVADKIERETIKQSGIVGITFISKNDLHGKNYYAYVMPDDSMIRTRIRKGDTLIVRRQDYAAAGDLIVADTGGETALVRRYARRGNIVYLAPESVEEKYKAVKIDTLTEPFKIMGRVVEIRLKNI